MLLTFVIPLWNEQASLRELHRQITDLAARHDYDYEIIFVDDGSRDESWDVISELAAADERSRGIRFRRNFGKSEALHAGFLDAHGDVVVTLDADLQDDPAEVPLFLDRLADGLDVVNGWKKYRRDPWHRRWASYGFNALVNRLTGMQLHDHNCGFKCFRRGVLREIPMYGDMHRFMPVLASSMGYRVGEVAVRHRARAHGRSKYGFRRIPKGLLDALTISFLANYRGRPQHVLGVVGLALFGLGLVATLWLVVLWLLSRSLAGWSPVHLHERALFYFALAGMLLGGQLLSLGFLAELFAWRFQRELPHYSVSERTGLPAATARPDPPLSEKAHSA